MPNTPDYQYITQQGLIVADTAIIRAEVEAEYVAAFGADIDLDPSTPQGVLITAETLARSNLVRSNADLANQINPDLAGGGFLDAICALTGLQRTSAAPSILQAVALTGIPGAIIPSGSRAKTAIGNLFKSISSVQLDGGGNAVVDFQSDVSGAIPCSANDLTIIVDNVLGWETVNNPTPAILGRSTQSDRALRIFRKNTLALQGVAIPEAMTSALWATTGVRSLQFLENVKDITQIIQGVTLVEHSVWACVDGGTDYDVAFSLLQSKSVGADWNGTTFVNVTDPASLQIYPVQFDRPTPVTIWVRATIKQNTPLANPTTAITDAILAWAANEVPDVTGLTVGNNVSPFEIAAAIVEQVSGIFVTKIEVSDDGFSWQTIEYDIQIFEIGTINIGQISVILS